MCARNLIACAFQAPTNPKTHDVSCRLVIMEWLCNRVGNYDIEQ